MGHNLDGVEDADDEPSSLTNEFCIDNPLCLEDVRETIEAPMIGVTPGPFGPTPVPSPYVEVAPALRTTGFCADEPLCLEDAEEAIDVPLFGPTPCPFPNA